MHSPAPSFEARIRLPRHPSCEARARRFVDEELAGRIGERAAGDAKLVVSELVANAYRHGEGAIELAARLGDGRLLVEVVDEGQGAAVRVREQPSERGGYGLQIVERLARDWGAFEGTTHVWAELDVGP